MDLGTFLVGAIMIMVFVVPIVLASRSRKNKEKQILQSLQNLANEADTKISLYDLWDTTIIGMSETSHKLFFYRKTDDLEINHSVDFHSIQKCSVHTISRTLKSNNEDYVIIDKLELCLTIIDKSKREIILEFYNTDVSTQMNGELALVEKWNKIINNTLTSKRQSA
ncbi:hypothetical protein [Lutibacter sp.]|uniref:hypothetical protein n=1 Tax=Lutibacter sp. TaxID=1925666 RepID=UPI0027341487|nr:hypothetical protein [Lutibacter sp.]MDP3313502.1 hypothetical protein [Lutibacter sp.]